MKHYARMVTTRTDTGGVVNYCCSCQWVSATHPNTPEGQEAARLESCRHLAAVLRFGSVTIAGDDYLVPRS